MALPVIRSTHNQDASLANLARNVLTCIDPNCEHTQVQSATLSLLLNKLIEMIEPWPAEAAQTKQRTVQSFIAQIETAVKHRDEDQLQATGAEPPRKTWG